MRNMCCRLALGFLSTWLIVGSATPASAQSLMFRGFGGPTQSTCADNVTLHDTRSTTPAPDKREMVAGGGIGFHADFLELNVGGLVNLCPNAKGALTGGLGVFPFRTKRVLIGASANFDMSFGDTTTAYDNSTTFFRPEAAAEIFLKHNINSWTDKNDQEHWREEGLAIDIRVGRYQNRANYLFAGLVFFVNTGSR